MALPSLPDMQSAAVLTERFRSKGLKVTPQRQLLFRLLEGNESHPSAEALFAVASAQMPGISLRTVYQTLHDLAEMGELQMLDLGTGAARFDPNLDEHHHLVCDECGHIRDVAVPGADGLAPAGDTQGFEVNAAQIVFRGLCASCRAQRPAATADSGFAPTPSSVSNQ